LIKKVCGAVVALMVSALLLCGCATALIGPDKTEDTASPGATTSVDPATVVVAEVNGVAIYKDAYDYMYNSLLYDKYSSGGDYSSEAALAAVEQEALNTVIDIEVRTQKMAELGYTTLTDEEAADAEGRMIDYMVGYIEAYSMSDVTATLEEGYTEEELQTAKEDYIDVLLEKNGFTRADILVRFTNEVANEKAVKAEQGDIVPTDEEIQAKYDEYVAADKAVIEGDPISYIDGVNAGATIYYAPSGVRRVRQVLISMDPEVVSAIGVLRGEEYDTAADMLLEEGLAAIEEEANDVLSRIESGELTFDEAIAQYNEDKGMPEEGYAVMHNTTYYKTAFTDAAMGLTAIGAHTGIVATDYGYHIIEYYADEPAGALSFETVRDDISDELRETLFAEAFEELVALWKQDMDIVTYEENL